MPVSVSVRRQRRYDHRLKNLVRQTRDRQIASRIGVPRSTLDGWLSSGTTQVVSLDSISMSHRDLQARVQRLERQLEALRAVLRLALILIWVTGAHLNRKRLGDEADRTTVLRAVNRVTATIPLQAALKVIGLLPLDSSHGEVRNATVNSMRRRRARSCDPIGSPHRNLQRCKRWSRPLTSDTSHVAIGHAGAANGSGLRLAVDLGQDGERATLA